MSKKLKAYIFVMDNTDGIPGNLPLVAISLDPEGKPFGEPGRDYSAEYPVTVIPLGIGHAVTPSCLGGFKKPWRCKKKGCNRRFRSAEGLADHKRDMHGKYSEVDAKLSAADFMDIYDDLPDGAFFAMAEEHGLSHEDFVTDEGLGQ